jgi:hypothetical protein
MLFSHLSGNPTNRELTNYVTAKDAGQNTASRRKTLLTPALYVIRDVSSPPKKLGGVGRPGIYFAVAFAPLAASPISFATAPGCDT